MAINNCSFSGFLTAQPELKNLSTGKKVVNFTIGINPYRKEDPALFLRCEAWSTAAEAIAKHFSKGSPIFVQGELRDNSYEKADESGKSRKHFGVKLRVEKFSFMTNKSDGTPSAADTDNSQSEEAYSNDNQSAPADEEIPF